MKSIIIFIAVILSSFNYVIGQYSYNEITSEEEEITISKEVYKLNLEGCPIEKGMGLSACSKEFIYSFLEENLIYPEATLTAGVEGQCQVFFQLNEKGSIGKTLVKGCHSSFEKPISDALANFQFDQLNHENTDIHRLDINFTLRGF